MLSIGNVGGSSEAAGYYEKADDYYTKGNSPSRWQGKAAEALNLSGEVQIEDFKKLLDGTLPNGEKIKVSSTGRRGGTDLTFSAPKSVSMQALIGGDHRLIEAHDRAVSRALKYAETLVSYRQTSKGSIEKIRSGNFAAATFRHELSRACDPQLHTHCVVLNMTQREDEKWRAVDNELLYTQSMLLGALYRSELAREVQTLGYEIRVPHSDGRFDLAHISDAQLEHFSQRSQAIEKALGAKGKTRKEASLQEKQLIAIASRQKKSEVDRKVLSEYWKEKSQKAGIQYEIKTQERSEQFPHVNDLDLAAEHFPERENPETGRRVLSVYSKEKSQEADIPYELRISSRSKQFSNASNALDFALEHSLERQSIVKEDAIMCHALQYGMGQIVYTDIAKELARRVKAGILIRSDDRLTTLEATQREKRTLKMEREGRKLCPALLQAAEAREKLPAFGLNEGQQGAAELVLSSSNQIIGVQGLAGTGKTFMLKAVRELGEDKEYKFLGLAPSTAAAKELEKSGISGQTIARFENTQEKGLDAKTVLVVDEAGMVSSQQMEFLFTAAKHFQCKVLLIGDTEQLKAVEAGKPFAQLQAHGMETAGMGEIQRQRDPELKKAVELAAAGRVGESVALLQKSVVEIKSADARHAQIARDYASLPETERRTTLIVSGTNQARKTINEKVRENLGLAGKGTKVPIVERKDLTRAQIKDLRHYKPGHLITPAKNYRSLGLKKGEMAAVQAVKDDYVILQRPDGSRVHWKPNKLSRVSVYQPRKIELAHGDLVRITKNDHSQGLINGDRAIVEQIDQNRTLHLRREDGEIFKLDAKSHLHLDHGYCSTVHSAQGKTCERVLIDAYSRSLTSTRDTYYVAISRARTKAKIYTNDWNRLPEALERENPKKAALEIHSPIHSPSSLNPKTSNSRKELETEKSL